MTDDERIERRRNLALWVPEWKRTQSLQKVAAKFGVDWREVRKALANAGVFQKL